VEDVFTEHRVTACLCSGDGFREDVISAVGKFTIRFGNSSKK